MGIFEESVLVGGSSRGKGFGVEVQLDCLRILFRVGDRCFERFSQRDKEVQIICGLIQVIISSWVFVLGDMGVFRGF